jgi:hypothetical protein
MFGFSRGAFTAKFLARMIHTVGLLCKGNEEMVPFAYRLYQRALAGEVQDYAKKDGKMGKDHSPNPVPATEGEGPSTNGMTEAVEEEHHHDGRDEVAAFSNTFCRKEQKVHGGRVEERNIKVYFLGMWDCVSSVAVLERKAPKPVPVSGTAQYVRHAVAVDERRVKFKVALLAQDIRASTDNDEDIKEVWFPGGHGDVGGGWPASLDNPLDTQDRMSFWQRIANIFTTRKPKKASKYIDSGPFQMSDIPLAWMIREVELVGKQNPPAAVAWRADLIERFNKRFHRKKPQALGGFIHDSLHFGHGTGLSTVLLWKFLGKLISMRPHSSPMVCLTHLTFAEWFPFTTRWELEGNEWVNVRFPLNKGAPRDIPPDAVLHESLLWRLRNDARYHPLNNHGSNSAPCLKHQNKVAEVEAVVDEGGFETDHTTYRFAKGDNVG